MSTTLECSVGTSPRTAAVIAGTGYVVIFVLAIFANFLVLERLVDPDDAGSTFTKIAESQLLFRLGLVSFLLVVLLDLVVAWGLYVVFKTANREVSLLAAWFRLLYTGLLGVALVFLFLVLQPVGGPDYRAAFEQRGLGAQVTMLLGLSTSPG